MRRAQLCMLLCNSRLVNIAAKPCLSRDEKNTFTSLGASAVVMLHVQEVHHTRVAIRPERRRHAEAELCGMFDQAMNTMEAALQHSGDAVLEDVLRAFAQWLQGTGGRGVDPYALLQRSLVARTFQELQGTDHFDLAVDVVDELIYCSAFVNREGYGEPRPGMEQLIMVRLPSPFVSLSRDQMHFAVVSRLRTVICCIECNSRSSWHALMRA